MTGEATAEPTAWLVSRRYDLGWFFGGAIGAVAVYALYRAGTPILALWWLWYAAIDSTHVAATFTRAGGRARLVAASFAAYLVGPAAIALGWAIGSRAPFYAFVAITALVSQLHIVRQHYGFVALYRARGGERGGLAVDKWATYVGLWAPYAGFALSRPELARALALPSLPPVIATLAPAIAIAAGWAPLAIAIDRRRRGERAHWPKALYLAWATAASVFTFSFAGRLEPVFAAPDERQSFLLVTMMATLFHDVQYHGLVWWANGNRARRSTENRRPWRYIAFLGGFAALYLLPSCASGWYGGCAFTVGERAQELLFGSVVWGATLQHYLLDTRLWRVRTDERVAADLALQPFWRGTT